MRNFYCNTVKNKLHIIVDQSLEPIYSCVQGAHAVTQWILDNQNNLKWKNDYLIFLKGDLQHLENKLSTYNVNYSKFEEPDLGNKLTAIAVLGNDKLFKNLKVVK